MSMNTNRFLLIVGAAVLTVSLLGNAGLVVKAEDGVSGGGSSNSGSGRPPQQPRPMMERDGKPAIDIAGRVEMRGEMRGEMKDEMRKDIRMEDRMDRMSSSSPKGPGPRMGERMEDRMERKEERLTERHAAMDARMEKKDELRAEMLKKKEEMTDKMCEKVGIRIEGRVEKYNEHHQDHVERFNEQRDRLVALIDKLEAAGVNVDTLKKDLETLGGKIKVFADLKASHIAKLEATKSLSCGDGTGAYKEALTGARASQQEVFKAAQDVVNFFRTVVIKDVQALKGSVKDIKEAPKRLPESPVETEVKAEADVEVAQ